MADLEIQDLGPVRVIQMNRPDKKNALTQEMYFTMTEVLDASAHEDRVRAIVISGTPGAFTSGNDLSYFLAKGSEDQSQEQSASAEKRSGGATLLRGLLRNKKPLLAAVDGIAVGIGTTMLFHCDYVVASKKAVFATPFTALGLVPEGAGTLLIPHSIGHQRAFALLAMGRRLTAEAAQQAGFVNEVVESGQALEIALAAANEVAALPPQAVALTRALMRPSDEEIGSRIELELKHFMERMRSPEAVEAFRKFLRK